MKSDTPLDYAVFQLSPKRSRCELFVSSDGNTQKLASGLVKPFVTHLKVAEEQVALACQSVKLEVERCKNADAWFTKGTLERFVRFVSTPEVLELVNTFDTEMSQLEGARRIYSEGVGGQLHGKLGGDGTGTTAGGDATKKELLRAIDVRLVAVRQDLTTACTRASAAGFNPDTVSELQIFADQFGAYRLNEACNKFVSLCERRPDMISQWQAGADNRAVRSSYGSDMSIDEDPTTMEQLSTGIQQPLSQPHKHSTGPEPDTIQQQHNRLDQSKPATCRQPKSSSASIPLHISREPIEKVDSSRENHVATFQKEKKEAEHSDQSDSLHTGPLARRLSVQDRINLFENKQKESSGSGGKPLIGKSPELRRLSSDVSSASVVEKAVLRRWSGASDMSIDLSGEKKETESPLCTPSSSSISHTKFEDRKALNDTASSGKPEWSSPCAAGVSVLKELADSQTDLVREEVFGTKVGTNSSVQLTVSSSRSGDISESNKLNSTLGTVRSYGWKDQTHDKIQSRSSVNRVEDSSLKGQAPSLTQFRPLPSDRAGQFVSMDQGRLKGSFGSGEHVVQREQIASETNILGLKDQADSQTGFGAFLKRVGDDRSVTESCEAPPAEFLIRFEDVTLRDQSVSQSRFKGTLKAAVGSGQLEGGSQSRFEGDSLTSQPRGRSWGEIDEVGGRDLAPSEKQSGSSVTKVEDSGLQRMKFQKQVSALEQIKKSQGRRDERIFLCVNNISTSSVNALSATEAFSSFAMVPAEQVQKARQARGNQELNDELKMKANELEKLFAEHKLRVPGDQSNSARRSKPADMQTESPAGLPYRKEVTDIASTQLPEKNPLSEAAVSSINMVKFNSSSLMKMMDNVSSGDALNQNSSELGFLDNSRGKFYDCYMQKRDAKLREEWGSKRAEKEAKLKAMQDSLDRSKAELKAKLSRSTDGQDSTSADRRAERIRTFNARSTMKREQRVDFMQSEDDEDLIEFPERSFGQDTFSSDTFLGDGVSRSTLNKKHLLNRSLSSSTPRTSAPPVPRSAGKASNSTSGRRRMQPEYPLIQSVPNLSDLRKENTKPSSAASKTASRPQLRNYTRSKSTSEEIPIVKEEKPRRSQSLRKSFVSYAEIKDTSLKSEDDILTPLKIDEEQTDQSLQDRFSRNVERPYLRKGNGIGPGAGHGIAKLKASVASEIINVDEEEYDELAFEPGDSVDAMKDEVEEFETPLNEHHAILNNGESRLTQESEKLANSGSENGEALRSFSQVGPSLVAELPNVVPSNFPPAGFVQDSPGESPMSWNSHTQNPFSYPNEASDVDASVDSPVGSPASWNSHNLNQTEADAAQMRKKWGSAQKPILVGASSHNQSRKDVTKGFKRLLKFGRKSRGTETLVDWISATTSEGDDDAEDGRDSANRSSEDLRKSRMGYLQGHPSDDSFNESEFFSEQVQALHSSIPAPPANFKLREDHLSGSSIKAPRSFFSLSSFRSKGGDSKPR